MSNTGKDRSRARLNQKRKIARRQRVRAMAAKKAAAAAEPAKK